MLQRQQQVMWLQWLKKKEERSLLLAVGKTQQNISCIYDLPASLIFLIAIFIVSAM